MTGPTSHVRVALLTSALILGACGGEFVGVGDAGPDGASPDGSTGPDAVGRDAASPDGAGPDVIQTDVSPKDVIPPPKEPCPASPPAQGSSCAPVGFECEWGTNVRPSCNTVAECTKAVGWDVVGGDPTCTAPAATCPARYTDIPQGKACPSADNGLACAYSRGECFCEMDIEFGTGTLWQCSSLNPGCPSPRHDIGTPCTDEGLVCDYGACLGGVELSCSSGYWQQAGTSCPG
jgi:hypothetical protein